MPTKRGNRYYVDRNFAGIGRIHRSLRTANARRAQTLEDILLRLHGQGRLDLVRTFANGGLGIESLAEAYETQAIPQLTQKLERHDVPLQAAVEEALAAKTADVKESTLLRYRQGLTHFMEFARADSPVLDSLGTDSLRAFKAERVNQGAARETVNNDLGAVSVLATYCVEQGWISERPRIKRFSTKVRIRYLDPDQIRLYMAAVRAPFRPLFQLLVGSGMRLGEAESLRVSDLRLENHRSAALVESSKTASGRRTVFLPDWVAAALREHIAASHLSGPDRLFTMPRRTVQKEHNGACGIAEIHNYTIHDHRHTAAVHLARAGMPLNLLQEQLGHTRIDMTMRYARFHPAYGDVREYFEKVSEGLGVNGSTPHSAPHLSEPG